MTCVVHLAPPFTGGITSAVDGLIALTSTTPDTPVTHLRAEHASPAELVQATVVHCHHALRWPEAFALARRLGVPAVKTVHILQARQSRMRGLPAATPTRSETLQAQAIVTADRLTIATHAAKAMLLEDHPALEPARVIVLPLAPRLPVLPRQPSLNEQTLVALTRFDHLKGTDLLIEVVAATLATSGRRFVVAGGLPDNARADARWRDAFRAALTPEQQARLELCGWLSPGEVAALLAQADVFVTTSRIETCGLGLMEAVAAGCAAVATDLPVHREVAGSWAHYAAPDAASFALAVDHALRLTTAPKATCVSGTAQDWLHFWAQTR